VCVSNWKREREREIERKSFEIRYENGGKVRSRENSIPPCARLFVSRCVIIIIVITITTYIFHVSPFIAPFRVPNPS